jgi:hypothetical protein
MEFIMTCKKKHIHQCDSEITCKATAEVAEQVEAELQVEDQDLEELLNAGNTTHSED